MRWAGMIGYGRQTEITPGVWEEVVIEVPALGELKQRTEALDSGDSVLPQYRTTTSVSVLSDGKRIPDHEFKYITKDGERYEANTVYEPPRLVYYLGGEYRGPTPD
jgi:hypothetical protein